MKPGDLIIKIDGKVIQNMGLREAVNRIKGKKGTKVTLTIIRKGEESPINLNIMRETVKLITLKKKMLGEHYAYLRLTFFQGPVDEELSAAIKELRAQHQLRGLILDLRNNPGGLLDVSAHVANLFLDEKSTEQFKYNNVIVYTKGRIPGSDIELKVSGQDMTGGLPLVILINNGSASASEIVAGALQDYRRAIIMGTASFGKGSVQTVFPLDDSAIKLTTALYYTPAGRVIQAKGIQPDVIVPPLQVSGKTASGLLDIEEDDYQNHLSNGTSDEQQPTQASIMKYQKEREADLELAKEDYQLFEGLMMLKGLASIHKKQ